MWLKLYEIAVVDREIYLFVNMNLEKGTVTQ